MRTLKPVDEEVILAAARETRLLVPIEDHFLTGGLNTIIAEVCQRHRLAPKVLPIALEHRWFKPALLDDVLQYEGFTGAAIAARVRDAL
jgi:transketolase